MTRSAPAAASVPMASPGQTAWTAPPRRDRGVPPPPSSSGHRGAARLDEHGDDRASRAAGPRGLGRVATVGAPHGRHRRRPRAGGQRTTARERPHRRLHLCADVPRRTRSARPCSIARVARPPWGSPPRPRARARSAAPTRVSRSGGTAARPRGPPCRVRRGARRPTGQPEARSRPPGSRRRARARGARRPGPPAPAPPGEREVEQLRHLGADLPGLAVDGVAAEQDEVEGAGRAERGGERPRRGEGVGAREAGVATCIPGSAPRPPPPGGVLGRWGPERRTTHAPRCPGRSPPAPPPAGSTR